MVMASGLKRTVPAERASMLHPSADHDAVQVLLPFSLWLLMFWEL